ncbi:MAG: nucleotidyltransferase domain-containing protein [Gammaproteobacteria bacterium]|nr:nucleotidyltransferase domain-containing protein [Aestuariivita sp.]MCY4281426.1 nucleotidyltransferase domain-containing protein [Gammaproteobacteria bacterium]MCY4339205.1 nucleotidyltransferase domain-containing protein [Gammaproteobacteria bacterium]
MNSDFGLTAPQRETLREILNTLDGQIEKVAVFGSRATGRQRPNSDLDLVLYGCTDEAVCDRLRTLLQDSPLPFSVDVKSYTAIRHSPLKAHIDAVALPLFEQTDHGLVAVNSQWMSR